MTVDPSSAVRGTQRVSKSLGRMESTANKARASLARVAGALGGALALATSVRTLASFSQAMSTIKAITRATGETFDDLRDKAKDLGATTRFTATQAAEGMLFLARAGFETDEVLGAIAGTLQLAQAGALELGRAADIASNILKGFRLEIDQTGRVVDVLAEAANSSNTTVEQLGSAMKFVAPVAAGMGVKLEAVTAVIGALSDAGLQATMAGTGLRRILSELESPSEKTRKILRSLGVTTDEVRISQVGLTGALVRLAGTSLTTGDALEIFGDRGGPAFEVAISSIPGILDMAEALESAGGTALRVSTIMDDNLNGSLLRVKSAFESIVLEIGAAGTVGGLRGLLDRTAALMRLMADNADVLATGLGVLAAVMGTKLALGAVVLLITGLKNLSIAMLALSARALPLLTTAALLTFGTIAAVAVAEGRTMAEAFDEIKATLSGLFDDLLEPVGAINAFDASIGLFNDIIRELGGFSSLTKDQIADLRKGITSLRDEVRGRLLLQEFIAPSSRGVEILTSQVEVLELALERLKEVARGGALEVTVRPGGAELTEVRTTPEFQEFIRDLERESELLGLNSKARSVREALFQAEDAAARKLLISEKKVVETLAGGNFELARQVELLDEITGPTDEYAQSLRSLDALLGDARISQEQFNEASRDARITFLESQKDMASGAERAFLKMGRDAGDFATETERVITSAFTDAGDALAEFVATGKLDFASLVDSILVDLARLAIKTAIVTPLSNVLSGVLTGISFSPGTGSSVGPTVPGTTVKGAHGGLLRGAGSGVSDSIPTLLSRGEFVTNAENTARFLPLLRAINGFSGGSGGGGQGGGVTVQVIDQRGSQAAPVSRQERVNANGTRTISLIIRDTVGRQISSGELDSPFQARFGLNPATR